MVVKYIKVTFVTIFALVVGLISTTKIKAETQGETWVINESPTSLLESLTYSVNFESDGTHYVSFSLLAEPYGPYDKEILKYDNTEVLSRISFEEWIWLDQAYRTITFETAPSGYLLTWLEANAVKQIIDVSYTQEDLDNAWADGYDVGISTVHENGFAGIYNPFTGQFYNNENSFSYTHGWYAGYDVGYDEAVDGFDYEEYYSLGIKMAYMNGFGGYINPLTNEYYDITNSFSYIKGFNEALSEDYTFTGLLFQIFDGVGSVLSIELLPNITLGAIVAVPIVFGIIYFILGKRKED